MPTIEFWPDHGPGLVWSEDGQTIDPMNLPVEATLGVRLAAWNGAYAEDKVPLEGPGDAGWLRDGRSLPAELRGELGTEFDVVVTEPWRGEEPR